MSGGWKSSDRRARLPKGWSKIAARVAKRDGYVCQQVLPYGGEVCGKPYDSIDHVIPNDDHSESNLQALCGTHHARKTGKEAAAGRSRRQSRSSTWPS